MTHKAPFSAIFIAFLSAVLAYAQPDLIIIPFQDQGNMIVVEGTLNGRAGNLIVDTGIAKMLINETYVQEADRFTSPASSGFQSVNGSGQNLGMSLVTLQISLFSAKTAAQIMDLKGIESRKGMDILGVVGIDLFRKYELEIDYFSKEIRLYDLDRNGNRHRQEPQPLPTEILPFRYEGHLPCITAHLFGQTLQLGLDTGAEINFFSSSIYESSGKRFQNPRTVTILALNGQGTPALSAQMTGLQIGALEMPPMQTAFAALNTQYGGLDGKSIHGLLGYEFFRHFRIAINFKKREVFLWDEESTENPIVARERN
jgi:hypothetical protein